MLLDDHRIRERGDEGYISRGGRGVVFHHLSLVWPSLRCSAGILHTPSTDPHITHSCVNKEKGEMEKEGKDKDKEREILHRWVGIRSRERMILACHAWEHIIQPKE